ncbi:metal ABC transporter ATP-binding protein [Ectothiorhodospiraceae bacterium BW-2]|nr:metal ABC transporter ATP-binding protein [Ectothiorhodospiraceae bacterium BW-2]
MTMEVITLSQVSFTYERVPVLQRVDLSVSAGEFLAIVGPNAGGKSTLLKLILGLLKPQQGRVTVLGRRPVQARRHMGYVPQYPAFARDFPISVEQVVALGCIGRDDEGRWPWRRYRARHLRQQSVAAALAEVEAESIAKRQIGNLSGGQLQRVLLARALVSRPQLLLLDEPTANIDQRLEGEIFELLRQLNQRMTIVVVSHDIAFISRYVNRVACINQTLVCHPTDAISGEIVQDLYGESVRMIHHHQH